jgi:hypothetical protein
MLRRGVGKTSEGEEGAPPCLLIIFAWPLIGFSRSEELEWQ